MVTLPLIEACSQLAHSNVCEYVRSEQAEIVDISERFMYCTLLRSQLYHDGKVIPPKTPLQSIPKIHLIRSRVDVTQL